MNAATFATLFGQLGMLLLRREAERRFRLVGTAPAWTAAFFPTANDAPIAPGEVFPVVDHFLDDAEAHWTSGSAEVLRSSLWTEAMPDGREQHFEAIACRVEGDELLLIRRLDAAFEQIQHVYQKGRELSLVHEQLIAEIGKKEILLHCVVHDMSGPLTSMTGSLQIAQGEVRSEGAKTMLELGLIAAKRQGNLIDDLLDSFRSEIVPAETLAANPATAPDVLACAREVMAMLQPAFSVRGVKGETPHAEGVSSLRVVAEKSRLERVLHNLLQNAMRYSPRGGHVRVTFRIEDDFVRVAVEDEGPGVPPEVVPQLFQKFVRRGSSAGKAGLGLYFCRITVEQWGGTIGCEPRPGRGTAFWFRLRRL